jgi:hypothetical protein
MGILLKRNEHSCGPLGKHLCIVHNEPKMLFKHVIRVLTKGLKIGQ